MVLWSMLMILTFTCNAFHPFSIFFFLFPFLFLLKILPLLSFSMSLFLAYLVQEVLLSIYIFRMPIITRYHVIMCCIILGLTCLVILYANQCYVLLCWKVHTISVFILLSEYFWKTPGRTWIGAKGYLLRCCHST